MLAKFRKYQKLAEIYYVYHSIQRYTVSICFTRSVVDCQPRKIEPVVDIMQECHFKHQSIAERFVYDYDGLENTATSAMAQLISF